MGAASGPLNCDRRKNSSFSTVSANSGHCRRARRMGQTDPEGSSQWPSSDRKGAKAAVARDVASIQTAALNAMIRHRLDPESLGIVGRSMANRLA